MDKYKQKTHTHRLSEERQSVDLATAGGGTPQLLACGGTPPTLARAGRSSGLIVRGRQERDALRKGVAGVCVYVRVGDYMFNITLLCALSAWFSCDHTLSHMPSFFL